LADQEIKSRHDAIKALEKVAKDLITEARDMRRMFNMSITEEDEDDE
jgi:ribosome recycling factor